MSRNPSPSARLQALYDQIPALDCQKRCGYAYCGPVVMSGLEWQRLTDRLGRQPLASGPRCPLFDPVAGLCTQYRLRPLVCRLWGTTPALACPWGCQPARWLPEAEARALITAVQELSEECGWEPVRADRALLVLEEEERC